MLIEGGIHSIGECVARTGMDEAAFRVLYRKVSMRKVFGWSDFPTSADSGQVEH